MAKEALDDNDFAITFPKKMTDVQQKLVLMCATIAIDYLFFAKVGLFCSNT